MPGKRFGAEQIIPCRKPRWTWPRVGLQKNRCDGADVLPLAQGVRRHSDGPGQANEDLEKENGRLKRLLADAELDKAILREAASGNF